MAKPQVSVVKRQREQAKRERAQLKAARREQRKRDKELGITNNNEIVPDELEEPMA